jgi:hypothetical protein
MFGQFLSILVVYVRFDKLWPCSLLERIEKFGSKKSREKRNKLKKQITRVSNYWSVLAWDLSNLTLCSITKLLDHNLVYLWFNSLFSHNPWFNSFNFVQCPTLDFMSSNQPINVLKFPQSQLIISTQKLHTNSRCFVNVWFPNSCLKSFINNTSSQQT